MVKRDLNAWDFVKQKPKSGLTFIGGVGGEILVSDNTGYAVWAQPTITDHNIIQIGYNNQGLRVDTSNTVTISDLVVQGSANIPPRVGELRYNPDTNMTEVYLHDEWLELGYVHEYPLPRESKISKWRYLNPLYWFDKFINFMENRA